MKENQNESKRTVWIYAVVLFTSAFIVLLITAFSQIKFSKNIDEYKNKISAKEKEKIYFQDNLSSLLAENKKLKEEINSYRLEKEKFENEALKKEEELSKNVDLANKIQNVYEVLSDAETKFKLGNNIEVANLLSGQYDASLLGKNAFEKYLFFKENSFKKAARQLYIEGYNNYINHNYQTSIEKLKQSLIITDDEYFSDDCYFFIVNSYYKIGQNQLAKEAIDLMLEKYPNTTYKEECLILSKKI